MYNLPNNIIQIIYTFDSTYHKKYNQLKKEFLGNNYNLIGCFFAGALDELYLGKSVPL